MEFQKYRSRKFIVTLLVLAVTVWLAAHAMMDANTGIVLSAIVSSYNVMQGWIDKGDA